MNSNSGSIASRLIRRLASLLLLVLIGGFAAAALVRYSPGSSVLPEDLDPSISPEALRALHAHIDRSPLPVFYARYLLGTLHGGFGVSTALNEPVADLLLRRAPVTAELVAEGTAGGMLLGGLLAWLAIWTRSVWLRIAAFSFSGLLLAVPPAVLALVFFFNEAPLAIAVGLAVLPRLFGTLRALFDDVYGSSALVGARARGLGPAVIGLRYLLRPIAPRLIALLGVALVVAFGAAIPIEAICGVPGIGALALQAALARDMPVLCALALIVTFFVTAVNTAGDFVL